MHTIKKVTEEIKVYTEEDHSNGFDDNVKELYSELKSAILTLGNDIEMRTTKNMLVSVISIISFHLFSSAQSLNCILIWE